MVSCKTTKVSTIGFMLVKKKMTQSDLKRNQMTQMPDQSKTLKTVALLISL
jgi:hypothetical protein